MELQETTKALCKDVASSAHKAALLNTAGKLLMADAISKKGVETDSTETWELMAEKVGEIKIPEDFLYIELERYEDSIEDDFYSHATNAIVHTNSKWSISHPDFVRIFPNSGEGTQQINISINRLADKFNDRLGNITISTPTKSVQIPVLLHSVPSTTAINFKYTEETSAEYSYVWQILDIHSLKIVKSTTETIPAGTITYRKEFTDIADDKIVSITNLGSAIKLLEEVVYDGGCYGFPEVRGGGYILKKVHSKGNMSFLFGQKINLAQGMENPNFVFLCNGFWSIGTTTGYCCYHFANDPDIGGLVKIICDNYNYNRVFEKCGFVNLNAKKWDMSSSLTLLGMFLNCAKLETIDMSDWDVSLAYSAYNMFAGCSSLTSIGDVSKWNTSDMLDIHLMFLGCSSLESINLDGWAVENMVDISILFLNCRSLKNVSLQGWKTTSLINFDGMFLSCSALESVDLSDLTTSNLTAARNVFYGCSKLKTITIGNWDFSKVTVTIYLFYACSSLEHINGRIYNINANMDFKWSPMLDRDTARMIIDGLYNRAASGLGKLILQFHANTKARLTDEDIAIATSKGWTIA